MNRGLRYKLAVVLLLPVLMISFQNCGSGKIAFDGRDLATNQKDIAPESCNGHALGTSWTQETDGTVSVPQTCQFGGDLAYVYKVETPLTCSATGAAPAGANVNGELVGTTGACHPPTCGSHADASIWLVPSGIVQKPMACPDSTVVIKQDFEKIAHYKCDGGTSDITEYTTGNFIANESKCPDAMLTAAFSAPKVNVDSTAQLLITSSTVASVSYACSNGQHGDVAIGAKSIAIKVSEDTRCDVKAMTTPGATLMTSAQVMVMCDADQTYTNGKCVDTYPCSSFIELTGTTLKVPARTTAGVCYYKKLYGAIANGTSTGSRDMDVVSNDHDDHKGTSNPYIMGEGPINFSLDGARNLKLSGQGMALAPILVDNFVLVGSRPVSSSTSAKDNAWKAYGTADATIPNTNYVQVFGKNVTLTPFASGGTATVRPILFEDFFLTSKSYVLDVRALDCGGSREMSDIYLIFQ